MCIYIYIYIHIYIYIYMYIYPHRNPNNFQRGIWNGPFLKRNFP